jgi:hypothetical protein
MTGSGPAAPRSGSLADILRRATWSGFARLEHASIATDVGAVERYYFGATAESDGRAAVTLLTVGLRARPRGFGRLTPCLEFAPGIAIVKEAGFRYAYTDLTPPLTYTIPGNTHNGRVLMIGLGLEWRAASRNVVYLDARAGLMRFHDPAVPVNARLGVRFR